MPAPGPGGTQSSLASMVSWIASRFRAPAREQKKGAPIYSYSVGNDASGLSGNARGGDITQFAPVFQPTAARLCVPNPSRRFMNSIACITSEHFRRSKINNADLPLTLIVPAPGFRPIASMRWFGH